MTEEKKRGKLIVIEGPDGVGKSTQANVLFGYLSTELRGKLGDGNLLITSEPGGWLHPICGEIRRMLFKEPYSKTLHPDVSGLLFFLDHMQNSIQIEKLLASGSWVICDRWCYSQYAYNEVRPQISDITTNLYVEFEEKCAPEPDLVILLIALPHILRKRLELRDKNKEKDIEQKDKVWGERLEDIGPAYLNVRQMYFNKNHPEWCMVNDQGSQEPEQLFQDQIKPVIDDLIYNHFG